MKRGFVFILLMIMLASSVTAVREIDCSQDNCTGLVGYWGFEDVQGDDDFSDGAINTARWTESFHSGTSRVEENGVIKFTVPDSSQYKISQLHGSGKSYLRGNFDVQVDFLNLNLPNTDSAMCSFQIRTNDGQYQMFLRRLRGPGWGNIYYSTDIVGGSWGSTSTAATTVTSGKFRFARSGSSITAYYYNSGWVGLRTTSITSSDMYAMIYCSSDGGDYPAVYGEFDNFVVTNGEIIGDNSTSENDGTVFGASWTTGKVGNALNFDASNDYLKMDDSTDWYFQNDASISVWIKPETTAAHSRAIFSQGEDWPNRMIFSFYTAGDSGEWKTNASCFTYNTGGTTPKISLCSSTNSVPLNTWTHVALTKKGTNFTMYINGAYANSAIASSAYPNYNSPLYMGLYWEGSAVAGRYFDGTIDETTIWNRSLSSSEVLTLYNLGVSSVSSNTNFTTVYGTTDFSTVSNISSVPNVSLATAKAKIKWSNNINAKDQDFDTHVVLKERLISINTTALDQTLNTTATLTLENISCTDFERENLLYAPGTFTTLSEVVEVGKTCPHTTCTNVNCTGTTLSFNVEHFTGYAYGGNANLTIDANDPQEIDTIITFTANYTNSSEAHISGATCNITLPDGKGTHDMNESGNIYQYNTTFSTAGFKAYNITCGKVGYTMLTANDTAEITLLFGEVPELKDYAFLLLIIFLFSAFVFTNKKD